jgi:hypothetical protein
MVDKKYYPFETIILMNRLDMEFNIDIMSVEIEDELVIIVQANENYHRTSVSKNIEQIACQLKKQWVKDGYSFSLVEYADKHHKRDDYEEWWQWRFNWVGKTPLYGQRYFLSSSRIDRIKSSLLNKNDELRYTG